MSRLCGGWRPWRGGLAPPKCVRVWAAATVVSECVPADGRESCGRTLGLGIRPALNPLLRARLGETPPRGRAPFGPPRADGDDPRRYGHLQGPDCTLT